MKMRLSWCGKKLGPKDVLKACAFGSSERFKGVARGISWKRYEGKEGVDEATNYIFIQVKEADCILPILLADRIIKVAEEFKFNDRLIVVGHPEIIFEEGDSLETAEKFINMLLSDRYSFRLWVKIIAARLKNTRSLFANKEIGNIRKTLEKSF
ncbi:hypothetical protein KJ866_04065 [Patescibacteria group bacterium]|nr:hypothetical protein [Patescibacteria group bacterium]